MWPNNIVTFPWVAQRKCTHIARSTLTINTENNSPPPFWMASSKLNFSYILPISDKHPFYKSWNHSFRHGQCVSDESQGRNKRVLGRAQGIQFMPWPCTREWPLVYYAAQIMEYGYGICSKKRSAWEEVTEPVEKRSPLCWWLELLPGEWGLSTRHASVLVCPRARRCLRSLRWSSVCSRVHS